MFVVNVGALLAALAVSVLVVGVTNVLLGGTFFSTGSNLWVDGVLVGFCTWCFYRLFSGPRFGRVAKALSLYDDRCEPLAFIQSAQPYVNAMRFPYNEFAVWLLAPYGMALVDTGRTDEALRLVDAMRKSVDYASSSHERGSMLVNMEPLVERLFGASVALPLLQRAQQLMDVDPVANDAGRRGYVAWERSMLQAQVWGQYGRMAELLREVRVKPGCSLRMRVVCALRESVAHRSLGDASRERECLEFVVQNGGGMPAVVNARQRLSEMEVR